MKEKLQFILMNRIFLWVILILLPIILNSCVVLEVFLAISDLRRMTSEKEDTVLGILNRPPYNELPQNIEVK